MKKLLVSFALAFSLLAGGLAMAQTSAAPVAATAASDASATPAAPSAAAATTTAAPAAAPITDTVNKGDTAWMIVATLLVIMMSIPGLALFYGGLVRSKNMLSILMQVFVIFSLIIILWTLYGYSVAFTAGNPFFGSLDKIFMKGVTPDSMAATFSKGVAIPEYMYMAFQATFAAITVALVIGSLAERARFSAVLLFAALWFTFSYLPIAHMVWYWDGPDGIVNQAGLDKVTADAGWLWAKGALDFAGGTVVHINA
ncbi:MAG: ammonium transporter, partial [Rhodoferax sp.]